MAKASKTAKSGKYVYLFGNKTADGNGGMKPLLGGKGANLAEMSRIGLPVPPGFTITTEVCTYYYQNKRSYPKSLEPTVKSGVAFIEKIMGTKFGDKSAMPLLVSVRSGARDSMPGMMDTILNLGLNDETVLALVKATKNERFAWDCYRRFIQMYGDVVMGVQKSANEDHEPFEVVIHKLKHERHSDDVEDTKLTVADLKELKGLPATIRFLDPPLHEFLPHDHAAQNDLAEKMGVPVEKIQQRVKELHEFNPMLGFCGCRLGIVYSEISEMQSRAIFEAAAGVRKAGVKVKPEVMIPLVGFKKELDLQVEVVHRVAKEVMAEKKVKLDYLVGTMIEIPRGALTADEIAQTAQFFSFGTNDLTQTCLGMSRDDSGSFLPPYTELEIIKKNPFASIDQAGTGQLMEIAVEKGRSTRKDIKLGICGEHGGDPDSVKFCHRLGLNYVSCSPFRVPVARLAAAQAALEEEAAKKTKKK